jgi:hypothetical protein
MAEGNTTTLAVSIAAVPTRGPLPATKTYDIAQDTMPLKPHVDGFKEDLRTASGGRRKRSGRH